MDDSQAVEVSPPEVDVSRPHTARMYDYYLGGRNHFAADRELADKVLASMPAARTAARENRAFMGRAVRFLAQEAGIRQFLDIGTGLPTTGSVHEIAQAVAPAARVVYVDNDPLVLAHARALLASSPEGKTAYVHADLRDPAAILANRVVREVLDFDQPVAVMLVAVLRFILDEDQPARIVAALFDSLPPAATWFASHGTTEHDPVGAAAGQAAYRTSGVSGRARKSGKFAEIAFSGLDLVPPGVRFVHWIVNSRARY